jgi:hypothetical protein
MTALLFGVSAESGVAGYVVKRTGDCSVTDANACLQVCYALTE